MERGHSIPSLECVFIDDPDMAHPTSLSNTNKVMVDSKETIQRDYHCFEDQVNDVFFHHHLARMDEMVSLKGHLGTGAFGSVVECHIGSRVYAFKSLAIESDLDTKKQVYSSERNALGLAHPNIAKVFHCIEQSAHLYILQEMVHGIPLRGIIGHCTHAFSKSVLRQLLSAAHYMHLRGVMHHDIKPENILIEKSLHVKLIDFGASYHESNKNYEPMGTLRYCAPEILLSETYTFSIDLWAIGVVFYEMITSQVPFLTDDDFTLRCLIMDNQPDYTCMPIHLATRCRQLLHNDPDQRW